MSVGQCRQTSRAIPSHRNWRISLKPYVICHMVSSVDGRTLFSRWRPAGTNGAALFERLHEQLGADGWLIGRTTGQEFAKGTTPSAYMGESFPRTAWFARRDAKAYGVVLDAHAKIHWGRADIGGDPIVVILTEQVSDARLSALRADGVSYPFAGETELDLAVALERLNRELGVKRLLLEGGGTTNGALLRAGLVDEISLVVCPAVDGNRGAPSIFDSREPEDGRPAPLTSMTLDSSQVLEGGAVWLRYRLR